MTGRKTATKVAMRPKTTTATSKTVLRPKPQPYTSTLVLTVKQAAETLQVSERKMWYMVGRGVVRSIKADGRSRRVPLSALHEYIELQLHASA